MRYLITLDNHNPFYTNWFEPENNFIEGKNMVVFDLINHCYTNNGIDWNDIIYDHL